MRLSSPACAAFFCFCAALPLARAKGKGKAPKATKSRCPADMVAVRGFCIDRYEAYTVELLPRGKTRAHSPFEPVAGLRVKAMNRRGKLPQGFISRNEAEQACFNAGKRLCRDDEWLAACKGERKTRWPYGPEREPGRCNDQGKSSFNLLYGDHGEPPPQAQYTFEHLNDPRLNQLKGTLAPSGRFSRCKTSGGVFDMVGNLHEWTAAPAGTFRGGYYLDVERNGLGCEYRTTAHYDKYHDYSTGFRCCLTPGEHPQGKPKRDAKKPKKAHQRKANKSPR